MLSIQLSKKAETYLQRLCLEIPHRRVGSKGNQDATDFFAKKATSYGFKTDCTQFECLDWNQSGAHLTVEGEPFDALISPYSLGCHLIAPFSAASTFEELETADTSDKILLLQGDIAREQLMPKNFTFYNPEHHQKIIHLLETKAPLAIIAATSRNPELAGGMYPFPLIEDGDFDIPSVYMTDEEGDRLAKHLHKEISLVINATRIPSTGCNVTARKGDALDRRIVICAHIDSKEDTPGALDNASGIAVLLLLAELFEDYSGGLGIEIVALNGEDDYSAAGQVQYIRDNADRLADVILAVNIDVAGYRQGNSAYSLYSCPEELAGPIHKAFSSQKGIIEGEQWYQSDHMIFVQNQRPALAITSDRFMELSAKITHTPRDTPDLVDHTKVANIALALRDLLLEIDRSLA
ncbi:MAG: M28 family peptidase [Anaerolineaceae bacterium]|nr:M28 family peptidase [Anaerolineaceae bacterium]